MTKLWRAATLVLTTTALLIGPGAVSAFADEGDRRGDTPGDRTREQQVVDSPVVDVAEAPATDEAARSADVAPERTSDQVRDQVRDQEGDDDRARDVRRPECDPDPRTDRVHDCRPDDVEIRPALARCMEHVQSHTDLVIRRSLRWWWHVCHRIAWNHNNPV